VDEFARDTDALVGELDRECCSRANEIAEEPAAFNSRTLELAAPLFSHYLLVVITTE
jgi:hypothetical protein